MKQKGLVFWSLLLGHTGHLFLFQLSGLTGVVAVVDDEAGLADEESDADGLLVALGLQRLGLRAPVPFAQCAA